MMMRTDRLVSGVTARLQPLSAAADAALDASIAAIGMLTPILARPAPGVMGEAAPIPVNGDNHSYEVVSGYRRLAVARRLGLIEVPVEVREMTDMEALAAQVAENTLNETLHPVDGWLAVRRLMAGGMTEAKASAALGINARDLKAMRWLADLHPAMLDLCRLEMPETTTLRKIARAPLDVQERATRIPDVRGVDDDGIARVDWGDVENACDQTALWRGHLLDPDEAGIAWDHDWLAQPGAADEFTTTDRAAFLAAQEAAVAKRLNKKNVALTQDPKSGYWRAPAGYQIIYPFDVNEKLPRGFLLGWGINPASGRITRHVLEPIAKPTAIDGPGDDDALEDDIDAREQAHSAVPAATEASGDQGGTDDASKITAAGLEMIAHRKDQALKASLMMTDLDPHDLLMLMTLAWCADNVAVNGHDIGSPADRQRIAAKLIGPDGNPVTDLADSIVNGCARSMLAQVLRIAGNGTYMQVPSGPAAEWIGRALNADAHLPRFDDAAFLDTLKGETLRAVAVGAQVKWQGKVGDMRLRLVDQAPDWRPTQAQFGAAGPRP